ncbi:MAG: hypothetical protein GX614_07630 [Sandaracinaceae bacterium]|nr:hypothetical protein [Sandaracinaceae bacterium]
MPVRTQAEREEQEARWRFDASDEAGGSTIARPDERFVEEGCAEEGCALTPWACGRRLRFGLRP